MDTGTQATKGTAIWPQDFASPSDRLYPNLYRIKARTTAINELRRWIPEHLKSLFDETVKETP